MSYEERWADLAGTHEGRFRLDEAAMIIAARIDPTTDVDAELARLDEVAARCAAPDVGALSDLLFVRMGLHGDLRDYDDPRNSSLPLVLERGIGIPISLSVLMIEIGRRIGVALEGIGMPGHFLVREVTDDAAAAVFLDPFGAGRRLDMAACRDIYASIQGSATGWSPTLLAATPDLDIVKRMLANLTSSFSRRQDLAGRRWVAQLRAALPERSANQRLTVAAELAQTGAFHAAADIIGTTADGLDVAHPDIDRLRAKERSMRSRLN